MIEQKLFEFIKKKLPENTSFIDEIADVLGLSYDAAYRRINGKTTLAFNEAYQLIKHFDIPLNDVYNLENEKNISVRKKVIIGTSEGLESYFQGVINVIDEFSKYEDAQFIYASKDFSLYHSMETSLLRKFKLYLILNFLTDDDSRYGKVTFENFETPKNLDQLAQKVPKALQKINCNEIWTDTILHNTIYQLNYLVRLRLISCESAIDVCNDLIKNIEIIENRATKEVMRSTNKSYRLYSNKMINLNNAVFFTSKNVKRLLIPYTTLSFLTIEDASTNKEIDTYYTKQLEYSVKLSGEATMDRRLFFTKLYEQIDNLKKQLALKN